jgi:Cupin superfamily (DUF985)
LHDVTSVDEIIARLGLRPHPEGGHFREMFRAADAQRAASHIAWTQPSNRLDQLQPGPHRPLGVVLMRLRVAEIHQHAVAHVLRHEPAEAANGLRDAFLIGRNDLAQVLWVHAGGERCRTHEVREHDRDLAALRLARRFGHELRCGLASA